MVILREHISNLQSRADKKINDNVFIKNGVLYINNGEHEYKYENECYYIKVGDKYINMQGGIPAYSLETNPDEDIFVELESERG